MARKPRFDYPGAVHHVMNRGAAHQLTFRNDDDRRLFMTIVGKTASRFEIEILAWCLMGNHYHLVIRSVHGNISDALQVIGRSYTQQFNYHHDRDGALFRGRFHSVLVDSERYLRDLSSYVHNNPVAAGLVTSEAILDYVWSSLPAYVDPNQRLPWLETASTLAFFDDRFDYLRFVQGGDLDPVVVELYRNLRTADTVLGTGEFVERVRERCDVDGVHAMKAGIDSVELFDIDRAVCEVANVGIDSLVVGVRGRSNVARSVAVYVAHAVTNKSLAQLADQYGFATVQTVSSSLGRMGERPADSVEWNIARLVFDRLGLECER